MRGHRPGWRGGYLRLQLHQCWMHIWFLPRQCTWLTRQTKLKGPVYVWRPRSRSFTTTCLVEIVNVMISHLQETRNFFEGLVPTTLLSCLPLNSYYSGLGSPTMSVERLMSSCLPLLFCLISLIAESTSCRIGTKLKSLRNMLRYTFLTSSTH